VDLLVELLLGTRRKMLDDDWSLGCVLLYTLSLYYYHASSVDRRRCDR
jgi:hypothetical protein